MSEKIRKIEWEIRIRVKEWLLCVHDQYKTQNNNWNKMIERISENKWRNRVRK